MSFPIHLYFKDMEKSEALEADIRQRADGLEQFYDRIVDCSVTIAAPHHHHHKGFRYAVGIRMSVPGDVIVVSHEKDENAAYEDPYIAVHDAFKKARRQLQDFARIQRGMTKRHSSDSKQDFVAGLAEPED